MTWHESVGKVEKVKAEQVRTPGRGPAVPPRRCKGARASRTHKNESHTSLTFSPFTIHLSSRKDIHTSDRGKTRHKGSNRAWDTLGTRTLTEWWRSKLFKKSSAYIDLQIVLLISSSSPALHHEQLHLFSTWSSTELGGSGVVRLGRLRRLCCAPGAEVPRPHGGHPLSQGHSCGMLLLDVDA